jgi:hypothetical protein
MRGRRGRYATELGIDLAEGEAGWFRWWLAALLFGARISETLAVRAYRALAAEGLTTPEALAGRGWEGLVAVLDAGGYVRYDFKTATKLLDMSRALREEYGGRLAEVHRRAASPGDLETRLQGLAKGIGPVTARIFLRELRGLWPKAQPALSPWAARAATALGFLPREPLDGRGALDRLRSLWREAGGSERDFADFEAALVREGLASRRRLRTHQPLPLPAHEG